MEDYLPITKQIKDKNYILVYNCKENHSTMIKEAKKFAKEQNLKIKIINCYDKNIDSLVDIRHTPIGIEKFLGLIKNCNYFFTNSYHGICFAFIFKKNFFAYSRKANSEKILTILEILGLSDRLITSPLHINTKDIDYVSAHSKVEPLKNFSKKWLENALNSL